MEEECCVISSPFCCGAFFDEFESGFHESGHGVSEFFMETADDDFCCLGFDEQEVEGGDGECDELSHGVWLSEPECEDEESARLWWAVAVDLCC